MELVMPTSKVTRKGQVTIPQEIRETLGIHEGDTVQVVLENDRVVLRRIVPWAELAGSLGHLAHLGPDDEGELQELVEAAWTSEAVERLRAEKRPAGGAEPR
jgi:AbrB family looped-hinge helix DNA binding protein